MNASVTKYGDRFEVAPGISIWPEIRIVESLAQFSDAPDAASFTVTALVAYSNTLRRYVVGCLEVSRNDDAREVSNALIRTIRIQHLVRFAVIMTSPSTELDDPEGWFYSTLLDARMRNVEKVEVPFATNDAEGLSAVAYVYRIAEISNMSPAKQVAEVFNLERRTATNWIKRARERGFLEPTGGPSNGND